MKRPRSITIIGVLFIFGGLVTVYGTVMELWAHRLTLSIFLLLLPVGIGLLKGRPSSRIWAKTWVILFVVPLLLALACYPFSDSTFIWSSQELKGGAGHLMALGPALVLLASALVVWRCLSSERAMNFFYGRPLGQKTPPRGDLV